MANQDSGVSVFGEFHGVYDVDEAIIDLLQEWGQTYLNEVARRTGEPFARMKKPRSYRASHEIEFMPEDQRPCVVVVCAAPDETPYVTGNVPDPTVGKRIEMVWMYDVAVQVVAQGKKKDSVPRAHRLAMLYATAIREALIQAETDKTKALNWAVDWRGEEPGGLDSDADRTTAIGIVHLGITIPTAAVKHTGPLIPEVDQDPDSNDWPVVTDVDIAIVKHPTEQPFPGGE
jgi:hypothetical protein